jgi:3-oxoacyl-[acyl-carrier-protein] synthase III
MTATPKGFASALRPATPAGNARITGIGGYRPRRIVPNSEIVERIDSSDEWIRERSGIIERRWAGEGESVIDMSVMAATPALEMAGIQGSDLDAILVATVSWPYQTPAAAPLVAKAFDSTAMALDISAACAGYCHGIALANDMVRGGSAENVLVIGVERLSDFTSRDDRGTAFIFGDGAGAAVWRCRSASVPGCRTPPRSSSSPDRLPFGPTGHPGQQEPTRETKEHSTWQAVSRRSSPDWPRSSTRRPASTRRTISRRSRSPTTTTSTSCR